MFDILSINFIIGETESSFHFQEELQAFDEALVKKTTKKVGYTMSHLQEWYDESFVCGAKNTDRPKLIIVIPDIESFSAQILRQFFKSLR